MGQGRIVDLTELWAKRETDNCPCNGCQTDWCNISQWMDKETGHLMEEVTDCHDSCELLKKYNEQRFEMDESRKALELSVVENRDIWKEMAKR